MIEPREIKKSEDTMSTLVVLTNAFEGIASSHLAKIRSEVLQSSAFFNDLWQIYSKIRVDQFFHYGRNAQKTAVNDKELYLIITAEGGFSGDVDERIMDKMQATYKPDQQDIIVIGRHGVAQLQQRGLPYKKFYPLPQKDQNLNVTPLVKEVQQYRGTVVFYPRYVTLTNQTTESIRLSAFVQEMGSNVKDNDQVISEVNYIFEPSVYAVVDHLERSMLYISLSQLILDSKLAQYASRFRAMSAAHKQASDSRDIFHSQYRHSLRSMQDERLKEVISSLRKIKARA